MSVLLLASTLVFTSALALPSPFVLASPFPLSSVLLSAGALSSLPFSSALDFTSGLFLDDVLFLVLLSDLTADFSLDAAAAGLLSDLLGLLLAFAASGGSTTSCPRAELLRPRRSAGAGCGSVSASSISVAGRFFGILGKDDRDFDGVVAGTDFDFASAPLPFLTLGEACFFSGGLRDYKIYVQY